MHCRIEQYEEVLYFNCVCLFMYIGSDQRIYHNILLHIHIYLKRAKHSNLRPLTYNSRPLREVINITVSTKRSSNPTTIIILFTIHTSNASTKIVFISIYFFLKLIWLYNVPSGLFKYTITHTA